MSPNRESSSESLHALITVRAGVLWCLFSFTYGLHPTCFGRYCNKITQSPEEFQKVNVHMTAEKIKYGKHIPQPWVEWSCVNIFQRNPHLNRFAHSVNIILGQPPWCQIPVFSRSKHWCRRGSGPGESTCFSHSCHSFCPHNAIFFDDLPHSCWYYPLVNSHSNGKSPFLMGKSTINGHFQLLC